MHRFFIDPPLLQFASVSLGGDLAHQLQNVLRVHVGEQIILLDGLGSEFVLEIQDLKPKQVSGRIISQKSNQNELGCQITLYMAMLKRDNFEWVLQKGTELGVHTFVPMVTQRTIVSQVREAKQDRWRAILKEAAEQSERGKIPLLHEPLTFKQALIHSIPSDRRLIAYEAAQDVTLEQALSTAKRPFPQRIAVFIGAEGGFDAAEIQLATAQNGEVVSLGKRILRAETAALYTVSALALLYELSLSR